MGIAEKHKPRVANIIEEGKFGGPQKRISLVAKALSSNYETIVIFPNKNSSLFKDYCQENELEYRRVPLTGLTKDLVALIRYVLLFPFEIVRLIQSIKKLKVDLIHNSGGAWQIKGILAAKLSRTKVLWHLNDTYMPFIVRVTFFLLNNAADGFIYASQRTKDYYSPLVNRKKKSFVIQAPVDTDYFNPDLGRSTREEQDDTINIITVGNLSPVKGTDILLNAINRLNEIGVTTNLNIVGQSYSSQRQYQRLLNHLVYSYQLKNVHFSGLVRDIRPMLNKAHIYVCSSRFESSPIAVWEAMAMGLPIVSTDVGDVGKYVTHGVNGFIVPDGDEQALAHYINVLSLDPVRRKDFGVRSRKVAVEKLGLEGCAKDHESAYAEVLKMQ